MKIYAAMSAIMSDAEPIAKSRQNTHQNYSFRGIDEVYESLQGILAKHKVFTMPTVLEQIREERVSKNGGLNIYSILRIKYTFYTDDGSSVEATVVGEGMDSGDKASNKGMSVAHKYALLQAFAIPTKEPKDPENDSHNLEPNPGSYIMRMGKEYKDQRLDKIDITKLKGFADWLSNKDKDPDPKKRLDALGHETLKSIDAFLATK